MKLLSLNKLSEYVIYLFFAVFPFYTVVRVYNIPFNLLIVGILYVFLLLKVLYTKKVFLPKTIIPGFLLILVSFILGKLFYGKIEIKDFLPFVWGGFPLFLNLYEDRQVFEKSLKTLFYSISFLSFMIFFQLLGIIKLSFIKIHTHKSGLIRLLGVGVDPNPNSFAILFLIVFVLSWLFFKKNNIKSNIMYLILDFPIFVVLIFCESRSILYGLIISIVFMLFIVVFKSKGRISKYFFYLIGVMVFFILLFNILNPNNLIIKRLTSLEFNKRTVRWKTALNIWISSPIVGVGFENIKEITSERVNIKRKNVHNAFLETLAATGIVGFVALLLFILNIYILIYNFSLISDSYYIYFIIITTFFLFNLTHSMLFINSFWVFLWILETNYFDLKEVKYVA